MTRPPIVLDVDDEPTVEARANVARAAVLLDGRRFGYLPCPLCKAIGVRAIIAFSVSSAGRVYARCATRGCALVHS